jgi:hypothetical protein
MIGSTPHARRILAIRARRLAGHLRAALLRLGLVRGGLLLLALATSGCFDPVVGYSCATGFSVCGGSCVDLTNSALHCGGCNIRCTGPCRAGICLVKTDADPPAPDVPGPAGTGGTGGSGPGVPDADPESPDGGADATDGGDANRLDGMDAAAMDGAGNPDVPVNPDAATADVAPDSPTGHADASADAASPQDAVAPPGGDAAPVVDAPLSDALAGSDAAPVTCMAGFTVCDNRCVVLATDPDNCGVCNNPCSSGLCASGVCLQQGAGHLVVIGHDYVVNRSGMNNLLGNAVFLSASDPVAVLAYEGHASPAAIAGTNFAIDQVAAERGRQWQRTVGSAITVATNLLNYDVLLIYAQESSVDQTLTDDGVAWDAAMTAFLTMGKTIVLLDGPSTSNAGTFQIVTTAGLLSATARIDVTGQTLTVVSPADAVSLRVPRTYRAEMASVGFTSTEPNKVVLAPGGAAVVIHRTF